MKEEYDFHDGERGAVIPRPGKTRVTIYVDNDVLETLRERAEDSVAIQVGAKPKAWIASLRSQ